MNIKTLLGLGLLIGGAIYISRKTTGAKKLEFYPKSIDTSKVKFTNWIPDLNVQIINPSYVEQNVDAIFLNVYADDEQIGRVQITTPFKIPKLSDTVIKFPITIFPLSAGKVIARLIQGKVPSFSIKGTVASMGVTVLIDEKIS
jgi:hypothetical protein